MQKRAAEMALKKSIHEEELAQAREKSKDKLERREDELKRQSHAKKQLVKQQTMIKQATIKQKLENSAIKREHELKSQRDRI